MCLTIPYKIKSVKDNIATGVFNDDVKEFKLDITEDKIKKGDYVLTQDGYIIKKIPKEDADNLMKLFN